MRVGNNPNNQQEIDKQVAFHRALIPLYIPNEEDEYFRDAFTIFTYCIKSLIKTSISPLKISVISNGSAASVNNKLLNMQQQGLIDELIIETEGIGKINSLLKALRTVEERLITITDADVLLKMAGKRVFWKCLKMCQEPGLCVRFRFSENIITSQATSG